MSSNRNNILRFGSAIAVIILTLSYLAYTGVQESKSYYVTIAELQTMGDGGRPFNMTTLESPSGIAPGAPSGHALILNEYGWLWLNRDGSPTELTKKFYPALLGKDASAQQRLALNAYLLAGLTEYWRAYRRYAVGGELQCREARSRIIPGRAAQFG